MDQTRTVASCFSVEVSFLCTWHFGTLVQLRVVGLAGWSVAESCPDCMDECSIHELARVRCIPKLTKGQLLAGTYSVQTNYNHTVVYSYSKST